MINIFLQSLIFGIATAAICQTIVYYEGPFHVFPRFKNSLLPKSRILQRTYNVKDIDVLKSIFSNVLKDNQVCENEAEMWKIYHTKHNPKFYQSFRGTLYAILDCPYCLGPYVSLFLAFLGAIFTVIVQSEPIGLQNLISFLLVSFGSYGLHFVITQKLELL